MTGTGLKKCRPNAKPKKSSLTWNERVSQDDVPTTLPAAALASSLEALCPSGMTEAAIFVMLMEEVLVASIALG